MSDLSTRRTAIFSGLGLCSGLGLIGPEIFARAAPTRRINRVLRQAGPPRSRSRSQSQRGEIIRSRLCPTLTTLSSRRLMPRRCSFTMTNTTPPT